MATYLDLENQLLDLSQVTKKIPRMRQSRFTQADEVGQLCGLSVGRELDAG